MDPFRAFLEAWLASTASSQAELSRRSGVPQNVISRWLGSPPTRPTDTNLRKLAPIVGRSYEELMRMCGYLPAASDREAANVPDAIDAALAQTNAEMRDLLRGVPRVFWGTVVKAFRRSGVEGARDLAELLASIPEPPLSAQPEVGLSVQTDTVNGDSDEPDPGLSLAQAIVLPPLSARRSAALV